VFARKVLQAKADEEVNGGGEEQKRWVKPSETSKKESICQQ
jgi:hypothetical protein